MLLLLIGLHESVFLARELACKVITILTLITSNYNYYSLKSFACIILLLSGSIQYYSYMHNLSFDNRAYGQEQAAEVEDGRVNMVDGQEQTGDDEASEDSSNDDETPSSTLTTEDYISEDNSPPQPEQPPKEEQPPQPEQPPKEEQPPQLEQPPKEEQPPQPEQPPKEEQPPQPEQPPKEEQPPQPEQPPKEEQPLPPQQPQPDLTTPTTTPTTPTTQEAKSEDNASDQSTGPVKFAFVDSFWTDYTSLGGVIASTSSESTTAQPLPPVIKQEVEPGEGEAVLAVVLRNKGFADATSISGSLDLPSSFRALVTPEDVDSDTALASYNGVVAAGQTFTLYFRVEITAQSQVDREYTGDLKIRYFKVAEQEDEDTKSTTLDIPFRLTGKVILSTAAVMTPSSTSMQGTES